MYQPVIGNQVTVLCEKVTYNNLPELKNISNIRVIDASERNYMYGQYFDLTSSADFDSFYWDRYDYVKFIGTLEYTGTYWNVNVDGATAHVGSIMSPDQDLTAFIGKKVLVGGWFCGFSGSNGKFLNIVLREISEPSTDGSTEDVTPGDVISHYNIICRENQRQRAGASQKDPIFSHGVCIWGASVG